MHAVFGAEITLYNPTNEILQWCRKNLWVTNPEFVSRKRMNKWLGNTPEKLMLYKRVDGNIILPAGLRSSFSKIPFTETYPNVRRWKPQKPKNYSTAKGVEATFWPREGRVLVRWSEIRAFIQDMLKPDQQLSMFDLLLEGACS